MTAELTWPFSVPDQGLNRRDDGEAWWQWPVTFAEKKYRSGCFWELKTDRQSDFVQVARSVLSQTTMQGNWEGDIFTFDAVQSKRLQMVPYVVLWQVAILYSDPSLIDLCEHLWSILAMWWNVWTGWCVKLHVTHSTCHWSALQMPLWRAVVSLLAQNK